MPYTSEKFEENLRQAFFDSTYGLAMQDRKTNREYRSVKKEWSDLFDRIREKVEDDELWLHFEELQNHWKGMDDDCIYLQGIMDGVHLLKYIHVI
ncbi:MAG: hypothetical protein FWF49_00625 [Oscillospiraceae bacterium]|nr:hypothetical protein [Oscillospiraceae bacterium]